MQNQQPGDEIPQKRSRPLSVWLISVWYYLSGIFSINMIAMVRTRLESASAQGQSSLPGGGAALPPPFATSDLILAALLIAVNLSGAGFLFFLKKAAVYFFRAAIILNIGVNVWYMSTKGAGDQPIVMFLSVALGWLVAVAVCRHAEHLEKSGVLQ